MRAYCVDVSGSIHDEWIEAGLKWAFERKEPDDIVIVFDHHAKIVEGWVNNSSLWGRGGSDPGEAFTLAKNSGATALTLISDSYITDLEPISVDRKFRWRAYDGDFVFYDDILPKVQSASP